MRIPVYRGEFGLKVMHHVPRVYAAGRGHEIEIEEGDEALYPLAEKWIVVPREPETEDNIRAARPDSLLASLPSTPVRFVPEPHVRQNVPAYDVVICPRMRPYVKAKNWPHWHRLVHLLRDCGLSVFAGGIAESSVLGLDCDVAWDYHRANDATIEAMRTARVVVAACSGLAHLAVLCGAPLLLFSYRGRISPGPIYNSYGKFVSHENKLLPIKEYYRSANHTGSPIEMIDGWEYPDLVASNARLMCLSKVAL